MVLHWLSPKIRKRLRSLAEKFGVERRFLRLRRKGYQTLSGAGLEIGAFEHPAPVPAGCRVSYVDAITQEQAAALFPEIDVRRLVRVDHVVDLNREGLKKFPAGSQDFVIACHVIEHVENPGVLVAEMMRILRPGGKLVVAAPDRDFTFDRGRPLTPLRTLEDFYRNGRPLVTPEDYREMITYVHPQQATLPEAEIAVLLEGYRARREHLSVWTAASFREFLIAAYSWTGAKTRPVYEVLSEHKHFEYFGVWEKL